MADHIIAKVIFFCYDTFVAKPFLYQKRYDEIQE